VPKADTVWVGRRARHRAETDPENVAIEFKLEMGLSDAAAFRQGRRHLEPAPTVRGAAQVVAGRRRPYAGQAPDSVVITVPAAFALNQNKATSKQPGWPGSPGRAIAPGTTAAASRTGSTILTTGRTGWSSTSRRHLRRSVVSKRDGDLRVLNHAGDPYLGGKLIDWAVVERLFAPAAARTSG